MTATIYSFPLSEIGRVRIERQLLASEAEKDSKIRALERELALTSRFLDIAEKELVRRDTNGNS